MQDDPLWEPSKAFRSYYEAFNENADKYFRGLADKSGVDAEENRATVREYHATVDRAEAQGNRMAKWKTIRKVFAVLAILGVLAALIGVWNMVDGDTAPGAILLAIGIAVAVSAVVLIALVADKKITLARNGESEQKKKANTLLKRAWEQMEPLNALFDSDVTHKLIEKTVPPLRLDENFSMQRFDYLNDKYGFRENDDPDRSTLAVLSGEIAGNPFVVDRELAMKMGTETYHGSLEISWMTSTREINGKTEGVTHRQTLTASVEKPKPYYDECTMLIYGNEAAPHLDFTREPTHAERLSEKQLARGVRAGSKHIQKQQNKAMKSGGSSFTEMGNSEFDVVFGALDRNNEVEFRLLFTPLAQRNMLDLMKNNTDGYGDDFMFIKRGCLNFIASEHAADWDLDTNYTRYHSYDFDACEREFKNFNAAYFKSLYFELAPLLSIPLYQQHKTKEYIYKDVYPRNYTDYEAECAANRIGMQAFQSENADTASILKTSLVRKDGETDVVRVTSHAFHIAKRVAYVSVWGGDGKMHDVPVPWDEYLPVSNDKTIKIRRLPLTDKEYERQLQETDKREKIEKYGGASFACGLLCCLAAEDDASFNETVDMLAQKENQ